MQNKFRIQELAEAMGITSAAELAREAKIGQQTAYDLWNNKRSDARYSILQAIASVFGVNPDDLVVTGYSGSHVTQNGDKITAP